MQDVMESIRAALSDHHLSKIQHSPTTGEWLGNLFIFLSALFWALLTVVVERGAANPRYSVSQFLHRYPAADTMMWAYACMFSAMMIVPML